jgi:hypothetical protein
MVKFYRNLNIGGWSYKDGANRVVHCQSAVLHNVTMKQPSGQAFDKCLAGGHRAVFAWFKGKSVHIRNPTLYDLSLEGLERLRFNPRNGDTFFHIVRNGQKVKVDSTPRAVFLPERVIGYDAKNKKDIVEAPCYVDAYHIR